MGLKRSLLGKIVFLGGLDRLCFGRCPPIHTEFVPLSAHRHGQADEPVYRAGIFPDHVRIHGAHIGLHGDVRNGHHERTASLESPNVQLGTIQARKRRQVFLRDRESGSEVRRKRSRGTFSNLSADATSPGCTRTEPRGGNRDANRTNQQANPGSFHRRQATMLKYFFIMFAFLVLVVLAMAGFRGQKSGQPPIEIFPDMDRQPKVKAADAERILCGRARRAAARSTARCRSGYSMPMHKLVDGSVGQATGPYKQIIFSSSPTYSTPGKMGENWGTGIPFEISPASHGSRSATFWDLLRCLPRRDRRGKWNGSKIWPKHRAEPASRPHSQ